MEIVRRDTPLPATDGLGLGSTVFEPAKGPARGTVLVFPGVGFPRRSYRHVAAWLASRGLRVVTMDYRGMFGSGGAAGIRSASLTAWARRDAVGALRHVAERYGWPAVLAHSFGGQILGLDPAFSRLESVVTIGSGFGTPTLYRGRMRALVTVSWYVTLPLASAVFTQVPGWLGLGTPLPAGVAREWARWGRSPQWLLDHIPEASSLYGGLRARVLAFRATDDPIATRASARALLDRLDEAQVLERELEPAQVGMSHVGHAGLLRPAAATHVWPEMLAHFTDQDAVAEERPWSHDMSRGA